MGNTKAEKEQREQEHQKLMNDYRDLLVKQGIYTCIENVNYSQYKLLTNEDMIFTLDIYCPCCKQDKTYVFKTKNNCELNKRMVYDFGNKMYDNHTHEIIYKCPTCKSEVAFYLTYDAKTQKIRKIGQYPSLHDISRDKLKIFEKSKLIDKEDLDQIYKAQICASEGFYVASYAYMRRVFENFLSKTFDNNKSNIDKTYDDFVKMRSNEKVELLKDFLPIDDNIYAPLYQILSAGIHSAPEKECEEDYLLLITILLDILQSQKAKEEQEKNRKQIQDLYSQKRSQSKDNAKCDK